MRGYLVLSSDSEAIIDALITGHSDQDQDGNGAAHGNDRPLAAGHPTQVWSQVFCFEGFAVCVAQHSESPHSSTPY